jgi:two-component system response regulator TctD
MEERKAPLAPGKIVTTCNRWSMRILILDGDKANAALMRRALASLGAAVDHEVNALDGIEIARSEAYSLILLSHLLQDSSGAEALRKLRRSGCEIPVMILATQAENVNRIEYFNLGADDCLTKPFDLLEFEARVKALTRRAKGRRNPTLECGRLVLETSISVATLNGIPLSLRRREVSILAILMAHPGKLVRKDRLLSELFGFDEPVTRNVIEVHVGRLRKKIGTDGPTIRTVRGLGYLIEDQKAHGSPRAALY